MLFFEKLVIVVSISILHAGTYQVNVQYSDSVIGITPMKDVKQTLDVGGNTIKAGFLSNESREYSYMFLKSVGGTSN